MVWSRIDDRMWSHPKNRALSRSARGLFADGISIACDQKSNGFLDTKLALELLGATPADPDVKALVKVGRWHKRGDVCRCMEKAGFEWGNLRGYYVHDFLEYHPTKAEADVAAAKRKEMRDPDLKARVRALHHDHCRYCGRHCKYGAQRGPMGLTFDHVDPDVAAGDANLVVACRSCNSAKKKRTPDQAGMTLKTLEELTALHDSPGYGGDLCDGGLTTVSKPDSEPNGSSQGYAPGSGRVGSGRVPFPVVGPPEARPDSTPNPYLREGHVDPELEPEPPPPLTQPPASGGSARASPHPNRKPRPKPARKRRRR